MSYISNVIDLARKHNPGETEFLQAVEETLSSLDAALARDPRYERQRVLERLIEPERVLLFRVPWEDDQGAAQVNRGCDVEFSSVLGPCQGGIRFHSSVTLNIIKSLAFQQVLRNSLARVPLGGAWTGSDFNPRGKSGAEVMRFCQSFVTELSRRIGPATNVPGFGVGAGARETGYLFGQHKRIKNQFSGALTGKGLHWGGSELRPEAPGYGDAYFAQEMLASWGDNFDGKICLVSGSGIVARHAAEKIAELGGKVVSFSDSNGCVHDPDGLDQEKARWLTDLKAVRRGRVSEYAQRFPNARYLEGQAPWDIPCDCAFPCAIEGESSASDAQRLIANGCFLVCEGANMPCDPAAQRLFVESRILYGPCKAANAGGVIVSALEMSQDAIGLKWGEEEIDARLREAMKEIHAGARETASEYGHKDNLLMGANIAAFTRLAGAMIAQGAV